MIHGPDHETVNKWGCSERLGKAVTHSLVDLLGGLPSRQFGRRAPASPEEIESVEREFQLTFPADYRSLLESSNGGSVTGDGSLLHLDSLAVSHTENADETMEEGLPGMFRIGSDGGGSLYFYDPNDKLGCDPWAVFLIPMSDLSTERSIFVGRTLTDVIERIVGGEDFYCRPRLGKG
jgi:hypothetical protein